MKRKLISLILGTTMIAAALTGCGGSGQADNNAPAEAPAEGGDAQEPAAPEADGAGT